MNEHFTKFIKQSETILTYNNGQNMNKQSNIQNRDVGQIQVLNKIKLFLSENRNIKFI